MIVLWQKYSIWGIGRGILDAVFIGVGCDSGGSLVGQMLPGRNMTALTFYCISTTGHLDFSLPLRQRR